MNRPSLPPSTPSPPPGSTAGVHEPGLDVASAWISEQVEALADALRRGEPMPVEELIARHPSTDDETTIRLIYEDVCLRRDAGQEVRTDEVIGRFPRWKDELAILLGCDRLLRPVSPGAGVSWPEAGSELGPHRLGTELGRGASGRTFLATEPGLADRRVVLKLIPDDQDEHLSLARLQHTHIVPLYSEHALPERGLRALCMPYLGGASLARILDELAPIPPAKRRGADLVEALDRSQGILPAPSPRIAPAPGAGPFRQYLDEASYVDAVCWIAACLADALQYAHARGLFHMDVKPSNVLIAGDGQPMLLDFHLARGPIGAGDWTIGRIGGTPGWMAPEQQAALEATRQGRPVPAALDSRCDIYALGLLIRAALTGSEADTAAGPQVARGPECASVGLRDIIARCLSADPAARYGEAAAVADDLRRHLNDLPLAGVPNRSLTERWRKWRSRSRGTLAWVSSVAGAVVTLSLLGAVYRQTADSVRSDLDDGRKLRAERKYPEAIRALSRGLERSRAVPLVPPFTGELNEQLDLARRGQQAAELHDAADLIRFRYGLAVPSAEEAETLNRLFARIWGGRQRLIAGGPHSLDAETEQGVRNDLTELAIVWADLRVRLAPPAAAAEARAEALRILNETDASIGASPALDRERRTLAAPPGAGQPRDEAMPPASSAWEHYDLGRSYLRAGRIDDARREFHRTLETRPQHFWSHFYEGLCAYHLGRFDDAVSCFRTCIALAPEASQCYYNRALASDSLGNADQARTDYTRALELDPRLAPAALNRGILSYKARRYGQARADFRRALANTADRSTRGRIYYNLALADLAEGDAPAALAGARKAVELGCADARTLVDRLRPESHN